VCCDRQEIAQIEHALQTAEREQSALYWASAVWIEDS
jgi:hypothetical protein